MTDQNPDLIWLPLTIEQLAQLNVGKLVHLTVETDDGPDIEVTIRPPSGAEPSWTCPDCGRTTHSPQDIRNEYCGHCHTFML